MIDAHIEELMRLFNETLNLVLGSEGVFAAPHSTSG